MSLFFLSVVLPVVTSVYPEVGQMNYTVNETDPVTFECTATGIPAPHIEFIFSEIASRVLFGPPPIPIEVIRMADGEMVYQVTQTALINTTEDSDSGVYQCIATSDIPGRDSEQIELIVQGIGEMFFIQCSIVAYAMKYQ